MKKIVVPLSTAGIDKLQSELKAYEQWQKQKAQELAKRLADLGMNTAQVTFSNAIYDGTNDAKVTAEPTENGYVVRANGKSVLFIEFGTGVKYPDNHPEASEHGMVRGQYGYKFGRLPNGWRYRGEPGTNGEPDPDHPGYIHTYGNPPAMAMYEARKQIIEELPRIVKEVFA